MGTSRAEHWDSVYRNRAATDLSWFQTAPKMSMALIDALDPRPTSVLDVGAGESVLVDTLLDAGIGDVAVLDVSAEALDKVRERLGDRADAVAFVVADLLTWAPTRHWDLWHDRAVLHFLVDPADRARYVATAAAAVPHGGHLVVAAFAPGGPDRCSGLPAAHHDAGTLAALFSPDFTIESIEPELHTTPAGVEQPFTWAVLRRQ